MSKQNRATTALKSFGAAGLAAATIVSGLSFGPAAHAEGAPAQESSTSTARSERAVSAPFKLVWAEGSNYLAFTRFGPNLAQYGTVQRFNTLAAAQAASPQFTYDADSKTLYTDGEVVGVVGQSVPGHLWYALRIGAGRTPISFPNGRLTAHYLGADQRVSGTNVAPPGNITQMTVTTGGGLPIVSDVPNDSVQKLSASVGTVDNIAKTAVVSGKATPGAKVSIGDKETTASTPGGDWSITVTGLNNGANSLTAIQKVNGTEIDRQTVTATITLTAITGAVPGTYAGGTTGWGRMDVQHAGITGPLTVKAPTGMTLADVDPRHVRDDGSQTNYRITYNADRTSATVDGPTGSQAYWGTSNQYIAFRLAVATGTNNGTHRGTVTVARPDGSAVAEGSYNVVVAPSSISPMPQSTVDLERGGDTNVSYFVQSNNTQTDLQGTVEVNAPAGTTFASDQTRVAGQWRTNGNGSWADSPSLDLKNGRVSDNGKKMTFELGPTTGTQTAGQQFRWSFKISTPRNAEASTGSLTYAMSGTSSFGGWRATGSTPTRISTAALTATVGDVDNDAKTAVVSGQATPGATVSIGSQETTASSSDGDWSITVTGLSNNENRLTAVQTIGSNEIDRVSVTVQVRPSVLVIETPQNNSTVTTARPTFSGTGDEGATIRVESAAGLTLAEATVVDGKWSAPANTDLSNGTYTLSVIQTALGGGAPSLKQVTFTVAIAVNGGISAGTVDPTTLNRGGNTGVPFMMHTDTTIGRYNGGQIVFTAPEGTTFPAQTTAPAQFRDTAQDAWTNDPRFALTNGTRSNDNKTLTFTMPSGAGEPAGLDRRWTVQVATPDNASIGNTAMGARVTGSTNLGAIDLTGSSVTRVTTAALTAEVESVDDERRSAVVSGTASLGAAISIGDESTTADDTTGEWSLTIGGLEVGDNELVVIQKIDNREIDRKTVTATVEGSAELAPITLSGPASVTPGRSNTFTGTAEPGATYRVLNVSGNQIVPGTHEVGADGNWTFDRVVSNGASNFRFLIEQTKNGQTVTSELFTIDATALAPVTVLTPERVTPGRSNTFTGTGEPGATYRVLNYSGNQIVPGTHEVDSEGNWTFDRVVSNGAKNFRFVIEQTKNGQVEKSELFTIDAAALTPVTVLTPERVTPGRSNTFTGTGEPGATYRVLNISGTQIVPGTHEVDSEGNWTFNRVVSNGASNFRFVIEQTKSGQVEKSELFTINAADFAPVTVDNRAVTPGVVNTFTGTGEPGATYRVLNITGTQIVPGTFEVDSEGKWSFDRAVSRGATEFRFALEQTKNDKTELSELFTLPADTK